MNHKIHCWQCPIKEHSLFADLARKELDVLLVQKTCIRYKKGQTLFYEETIPLGIFFVHSAKVKVYKIGPYGKELILKICKSGDLIGQRALISEEYYSTFATVVEEGVICYIPKEYFWNILKKNQLFFQKVVKKIAHDLGVMEEKLTFARKSVRVRVASTIINQTNNENLMDISLSRDDFANFVGTSTETLIRFLAEFKRQKLITFHGKKIKVLNFDTLRKEADLG